MAKSRIFADDIYIKLETGCDDKNNNSDFSTFDISSAVKEENNLEIETQEHKKEMEDNKNLVKPTGHVDGEEDRAHKYHVNCECLLLPPILHRKCQRKYFDLMHLVKKQIIEWTEKSNQLRLQEVSSITENKSAKSKLKIKECFVKLNRVVVPQRQVKEKVKFKCQICQRFFKQNYQLKSHMQIHLSEKPYKCSVCKRRFLQKYNCLHHERRHFQTKRHQCERCGKSFLLRAYLNAHLKWHNSSKQHT